MARGVGAAADHAGRSADAAWALHEIGTRNLALGDIAAATPLLLQALAIRRVLGDTQGAAYTLHNLRWFGLVGGGGGGGGTGIGRFLLGGGALVIGLAILAITGPPVAGFVVDLIAPARSPAPTAVASASGRPTSEPTHQPTPTPVQPSLPPRGLTVATRVGEYEFAGGGWVTSLEVSLTGGVGRYHVTIDKVGESGENPATFRSPAPLRRSR